MFQPHKETLGTSGLCKGAACLKQVFPVHLQRSYLYLLINILFIVVGSHCIDYQLKLQRRIFILFFTIKLTIGQLMYSWKAFDYFNNWKFPADCQAVSWTAQTNGFNNAPEFISVYVNDWINQFQKYWSATS